MAWPSASAFRRAYGNVFKARTCAAQNENVRSGNRAQYQSDAIWWLRSTNRNNAHTVWSVNSSGSYYGDSASNSHGIRPAIILPSDMLVTDDMLAA